MLKDYRRCVGRCAHLELEIAELNKMRAALYERIVDEVSYPASCEPSETPHDKKISKPTERGVMRLEHDLKAERARVDERIAELEADLSVRRVTVVFVEAWLSGLTEREAWVVTKSVIDGEFWRDIMADWYAARGIALTKRHMQRIKQAVMQKIYDMAR